MMLYIGMIKLNYDNFLDKNKFDLVKRKLRVNSIYNNHNFDKFDYLACTCTV